MQLLTLEEAKAMLGVTHSFDDARLQLLIDNATAEALSFMNRENDDQWGCDDTAMPPYDVRQNVCLLVQAHYEGTVDDIAKVQDIVERRLFRYRKGLGV